MRDRLEKWRRGFLWEELQWRGCARDGCEACGLPAGLRMPRAPDALGTVGLVGLPTPPEPGSANEEGPARMGYPSVQVSPTGA
jgi:hypothetical protein